MGECACGFSRYAMEMMGAWLENGEWKETGVHDRWIWRMNECEAGECGLLLWDCKLCRRFRCRHGNTKKKRFKQS